MITVMSAVSVIDRSCKRAERSEKQEEEVEEEVPLTGRSLTPQDCSS